MGKISLILSYLVCTLSLFSCSNSDEKIDTSQFVGDYYLNSCFTDTKHYSYAEGGCEITNKDGSIIIELSVNKNSGGGNVNLNGYIDGKNVKRNNGTTFGEILKGSSLWIYQLDGTTYEFKRVVSSNGSSGSSSSSWQCAATTQKGTRCKRMITSGIYCWQHK